MKAIVAWDIDDVIYPWSKLSHQASVVAKLGTAHADRPPFSWDHHAHYGVDAQDWYDVLAKVTRSGWLYGQEPDPRAIEAILRLDKAGAEQHFITARGFMQHAELIREQTEAMLLQHALPHASLVFTRDKGAEAVRLGITHAIDDNVANYMAFSEVGVDTYLMDMPHNRTHVVPPARRITDLEQFARVIERGIAA